MTDKLNFDIFVSYSWDNKTQVLELCSKLEQNGNKLWLDRNEMKQGNINNIMKKGIDESKFFMCCATTSYCKSENALKEFNYAVEKGKEIVYILFENFSNKQDRLEKLDAIAFDFAGKMYYKNKDVDMICKLIEELKHVKNPVSLANNVALVRNDRTDLNSVVNKLISTENEFYKIVIERMKLTNDINVTNNYGSTALHIGILIASHNGEKDLVEMLLVNNANINLKDQIGKTPLMTACNFGHHDVVKLLLNYNADINIKNNNNWSALDYAQAEGHTETVNILKNHRR